MTAIEASRQCDGDVVVVSRDTDVLTLLLARTQLEKIYLVQPQHGKPNKCYSIQRVKQHVGAVTCEIVLALHAMTSCDTTSAPFRKGKKKCFPG